jgi:hypothetical protein
VMHARKLMAQTAGTLAVALVGGAFFFAIVGVFGLTVAVLALILFVAVALVLMRLPQRAERSL